MKKLIQVILLAWFIVVNLLILGPSLYLLVAGGDDVQGQTPPSAPQPPAPVSIGPLESSLNLEQQKQQIEAYKQQVTAYGEQVKSYSQQVTAYTQQVSAYKTQQETKPSSRRTAVFELVVKNTLVPLITGFATGLIAFVFANLGATVVNNFIRAKVNEPIQPLNIL